MFPRKISKRNIRGLVVLVGLLALITMAPRVYSWFRAGEPIQVSVEELSRGVAELELKPFSSNSKNFLLTFYDQSYAIPIHSCLYSIFLFDSDWYRSNKS